MLATGARPRHLPDEPAHGVHVLRTLEDCLALRADLDAATRTGRGDRRRVHRRRGRRHLSRPGLEVTDGRGRAGAARSGAARTSWARSSPSSTATHGVDVRLGVGVDGLEADDGGRVRSVRLADGTAVDADVVVVGIGVAPSTDWLEGAG